MGEEWRRGWDPETIKPKITDQQVLVVGSGPAGLECSVQMARRGYQVILAESKKELGGRVLFESSLKGLSAWKRVIDNRTYEIQQQNNIELYRDSELSLSHINELGIDNIFLATGSSWRIDGVGRSSREPIKGLDKITVLSPEDAVKNIDKLEAPIVIYDDEQGYLAGVLADHLSSNGCNITFVTPASLVSPWTESTLEQARVQKSLLNQGVEIICNKTIASGKGQSLLTQCVFTGNKTTIDCKTIIMVTERIPDCTLYDELIKQEEGFGESSKKYIKLLGDAEAPGLIADSIFSGHLAAENFETPVEEIEKAIYIREMPSLR
jgi:dimethylamine/trimethylamine dehydrogenase